MKAVRKALTTRALAFPLVILLCLSQILVGGARSLEKLRGDAEAALKDEMDYRAAQADNYVKVAARNLKDGDKTVAALAKATETLTNAKTAAKRLSASKLLSSAAQDVYDALGTVSLSKADADYRVTIMRDLEESNTRLRHYYNYEAEKYNEKLAGFPAGLLASIGMAARMPSAE